MYSIKTITAHVLYSNITFFFHRVLDFKIHKFIIENDFLKFTQIKVFFVCVCGKKEK